ncbi:MAG: hypothetical protein J6Y54_02560 [Lentisphaeria bacterium]|jgi:hypothetical protein|nr:hypothetical protein [Lentisphaeria bacterium]
MRDIYESIRGAFPMIALHLREGGGENGLCRKLGVSRAELRFCRRAHPDLDELWRTNRREVVERVEAALLRRATGYEEENGKSVPPDVRAAVFWLKNRRPDRWRDGTKAGERPAEPGVELTDEERSL